MKTMLLKRAGMHPQIGQWYVTSSSPLLARWALPQWQPQSDSWRISSSEYFLSYNETALGFGSESATQTTDDSSNGKGSS